MVATNVPNFARPKTEENMGRGFNNFIPHFKLHSRRYIVDDTLFLQVEISPPPNLKSNLEDIVNHYELNLSCDDLFLNAISSTNCSAVKRVSSMR
ncbi:hypothetical protein pdam_00025703 [Pocillopora damicornis]|uniref:MATH domain-containing protein n=1 Tax=Pocillopora damicornis TaxID=46731 RepID=A0A3M6THW6_POCDA|nr:hypothetical protein pdam_00025703 [Pocillopora damicornis]